MAVERLDPSRVATEAGPNAERDIRRHIESDYAIRQGLCPNGCGLMGPLIDAKPEWKGQECPACHFTTNALPEVGKEN